MNKAKSVLIKSYNDIPKAIKYTSKTHSKTKISTGHSTYHPKAINRRKNPNRPTTPPRTHRRKSHVFTLKYFTIT